MPQTQGHSQPIIEAMRRPLVSVIVTTYNHADTLAQALDSILAQKVTFDIEIALSDDCSTDGTHDVCRRYAERYPQIIKYQRNTHNKGARDNYFDTLMRCQGRYIADLAGDDRWCDPHKLADQAAILNANPDVELCHTDWRYLDDTTGRLAPSRNNPKAPWLQPIADGHQLIVPLLNAHDQMIVHSCTALYRAHTARELITTYPNWFRNPAYPCEDLQLMTLLAHRGNVAYIDRVTLDYRVGHTQITSAKDPAKAFDFNYGTLLLRLDLQHWLQLPPALFSENRRLAAYAAGLARRAGDRDRLDRIVALCRRRNITLPLRTRLRLLADRLLRHI